MYVFLYQARMALSSPSGCLSDEEKEMAVFESTAAEHGGLAKPCLPEVSVISPGLDNRQAVTEPVGLHRTVLCVNVTVHKQTKICLHMPVYLQESASADSVYCKEIDSNLLCYKIILGD